MMARRKPKAFGDTDLPPRWAGTVRAVWVLAAALLVAVWLVGSFELLRGPYPDCTRVVCDFIEFSKQDSETLRQLDLPAFVNARTWTVGHVLYSLFFFTLAGVIFWRKSHDWMALLVALTLIYLAAVLFTTSDDVVRRSHPTLVPLLSVGDAIGITAFMMLFLTFPNGRVVPSWGWKVVAALLFLTVGSPLILLGSTRLQGPDVPPLVTLTWLLVFFLMLGVGFYSQTHRYLHTSTAMERQKTKWVVFGLSGALVVVPVWTYIGFAHPPSDPSTTRVLLLLTGTPLVLLFSSLFPLSLTISILRFRLLDIDLLIHRTLVYGALTGSLGLVYFMSVILLQRILPANSPLAVVISTLAIAALFSPLRRRIQDGIDRRFYRRKYDAERTLATFAGALREPIEFDELERALITTVGETVQPAFLSLWLSGDQTKGPRRLQ